MVWKVSVLEVLLMTTLNVPGQPYRETTSTGQKRVIRFLFGKTGSHQKMTLYSSN